MRPKGQPRAPQKSTVRIGGQTICILLEVGCPPEDIKSSIKGPWSLENWTERTGGLEAWDLTRRRDGEFLEFGILIYEIL